MPNHLHHVADVPEVESSIHAQVAQLKLLVQRLWHRIEGHANPLLQSNNNSQQNKHEPTTEGTGSSSRGTDTHAPLLVSI
jgi:hypothetical protein